MCSIQYWCCGCMIEDVINPATPCISAAKFLHAVWTYVFMYTLKGHEWQNGKIDPDTYISIFVECVHLQKGTTVWPAEDTIWSFRTVNSRSLVECVAVSACDWGTGVFSIMVISRKTDRWPEPQGVCISVFVCIYYLRPNLIRLFTTFALMSLTAS